MRIARIDWFGAAVGLLVLVVAVYFLQRRLAIIHTWLPVQAQVLRSAMEVTESTEGSSAVPAYELAYVVNGEAIRRKATSNASIDTAEAARQRLANHPAGSSGIVYVNPTNPSELRLNVGRNAVTFFIPVLLLATAGFLFLMAIAFWMMGASGDVW